VLFSQRQSSENKKEIMPCSATGAGAARVPEAAQGTEGTDTRGGKAMFNLWLVCDKHNRNPKWRMSTNTWGLGEFVRAWRYGYRRIRLMTYQAHGRMMQRELDQVKQAA